jgi:hypothetical protein
MRATAAKVEWGLVRPPGRYRSGDLQLAAGFGWQCVSSGARASSVPQFKKGRAAFSAWLLDT